MSKVAFFWPCFPKFFDDLFLESTPNFLSPKNFSASPNFFYPITPGNYFLDLKIFFSPKKPLFLDLKNFFTLFRPKNPFLDFLDLKFFSNRLNSLQKHLLNLQSDEKNYIFNFSIYSKKLP